MEYIKEYSDLHAKERRQLAYKRRYKSEQPMWDDSMVLLTRLLRERLKPPVDVLDVGCGHGNFVIDELGQIFQRKVGYDVSVEASSGNTSVDRVCIGNGRDLPFEAASFDLIVSLWTLEHVQDPMSIFREAARILRPDGLFAFVTPNKRSLLIGLRRLMNKKIADRLVGLFYGRKDEDVFDVCYRANSLQDIRKHAADTGFSVEFLVENVDPSYTSFGPLSYVLSKLWSSLPISMSKPHVIAVLRKGGP